MSILKRITPRIFLGNSPPSSGGGGGGGGGAQILFGCSTLSTSGSSRALIPSEVTGVAPLLGSILIAPLSRAGTLKNLVVHQGNPASVATELITYTVVAGNTIGTLASTGITVTVAANVGTVVLDIVNTYAAAQGELVGVAITKSTLTTDAPANITAAVELE